MITQVQFEQEEKQEKQYTNQNNNNQQEEFQPTIFSILQEITPKKFYHLQKEFKLNEEEKGGVDLNEFISIFCFCLYQITSEPEQGEHLYQNQYQNNDSYLKDVYQKYQKKIEILVEIFVMMDRENKNKVTWEQITDFIIEMQDIQSRDESLFNIKLIEYKINKDNFQNPTEKIYTYENFKYFGVLENNQKILKFMNPTTFKEIEQLDIGKTAIATTLYLHDQNIMIISGNDKYLNFYQIQDKKFFRRFRLPDVQTFIVYSEEKNVIYTTQHTSKVIYGWDLQKIFDHEFEEIMYQIDAYKDTEYKIMKDYVTIDTTREISYLYNIDSQHLLVAGTTDGVIRIIQNYQCLPNEMEKKKNIKQLKGHTNGIKCIAFNEELRYLVTCSFDYDIYIWNTYLPQHIKKLSGNQSPHVSVVCPKNQKYLMISCDAQGIIKLWDLASFSCIQTIQIENITQQIKSVVFLENHNKLICCSKGFHIYQFDKSYSPQLSDDKSISNICISEQNLQLYSSSGSDIRCWDLIKGKIIRVFKNITKGDITQINLIKTYEETQVFFETKKEIKNERIMCVGSNIGEILCLDILTGFIMKKLESHKKELVFLRHSPQFDLIISAGQDRNIKIFNNKVAYQDLKKNQNIQEEPMRVIQNTFKNEIAAGCISDNLQLIATVGRDSDIRFWEVEKGQFNSKIGAQYGYALICQMKFLDPLPILITADIQGYIQVWLTPPHQQQCQLLLKWKNLFTISRFSQVTCINYTYDEKQQQLDLVLGDETGYVRILDISSVIKEFNVQPIKNKKDNRNMYRHNVYDYNIYQKTEISNKSANKILQEQQLKPLPEKQAKQILQWQAHKHTKQEVSIIDIIIVNCTDKRHFITLGSDKKIQLFNYKGELKGILKQSETNLPKQNYLDELNKNSDKIAENWKFPHKKQNITFLEKQILTVSKNFKKLLQKRENIRKLHHLHFSVETYEEMQISELTRVDSLDIIQTLKEVDTYLYGKSFY